MHWGYLQSVDLYDCPKGLLKDKEFIKSLLSRLVKAIGMKAHGEPIVDRFGDGLLEGVSGFQFIMTSSITIHCDEVGNRAFVDVFSCKAFNHETVVNFLTKEFKTVNFKQVVTTRG